MDDMTGRTAVITGGASGIGLALAHRFGAAGMRLVLGDVERAALDAATQALTDAGYEVLAQEIDVRSFEAMRDFAETVRDQVGNVHLLCNNAGVGGGGPVAAGDDIDMWRWTIDVNLWGVIYGCKAFLPAMIDHGEAAHIVNTASMAGLVSAPMMGAYNVSKYGVVALSETLVQEMQLAETQIGVSVLCPAFVRTGIANSRRNLPADLAAATPPAEEDLATWQAIQALVDGGIPTETVADAVHDAVLENRFWVLTHPEVMPAITARADQIVSGVNPVAFTRPA